MIKKIFCLFLLSASVLSCEKSNKKINVYIDSNPLNKNLFISGVINGNPWYAKNGQNGCKHYTTYGSSYSGFNVSMDYSAYFLQDTWSSQPINAYLTGSIRINMRNSTHNYTTYLNSINPFKETFTQGQQAYYVQGSSSPGIEIQYHDENYNVWTTMYGSQAGSTFNFSSVSDSFSGEKQEKFCEGTYSCKVYREGNPSQYKVITNGSFFVKYEKMY